MKKATFLLIITSLITACASTQQFVSFPTSPPSNQNAIIYILRPSKLATAVKMKTYCDDKLIGKTGPNGYLIFEVTEGEHNIKSVAENSVFLKLNCKAGQTYYIKQSPEVGIGFARVSIHQVETAEGEEILKRTKKAKLKQPVN